jgi:carbamoyltransferase
LNSAQIKASDLVLIVVCVQGCAKNCVQDASLHTQLQSQRDDVEIIYVPHHLCHAISTYATSGFSSSDILVIDGVGSPKVDLLETERQLAPAGKNYWESLSCYQARGKHIEPLIKHMRQFSEITAATKLSGIKAVLKAASLNFLSRTGQTNELDSTPLPDTSLQISIGSLGSMFEAASWIIFGERLQAGKVMGLAAYGKASIPIDEFLTWHDGQISYTKRFMSRFSGYSKWPEQVSEYQDLASSVQRALEYATLKQIAFLRERTQGNNLCYAGGVALNTLLNERIIRESGYQQVYIVPAAEDSGTAIGAAYYGLMQLGGGFSTSRLTTDRLGHHYSQDEVTESLSQLPGLRRLSAANQTEQLGLLDNVVQRLCAGEVGGWFQGGAELGPRALGQRSLLCDARSPSARDYLNNHVKHRESFRPFAPIVLQEYAAEWFDFGDTQASSPFMLRVADVLPHARETIPAVIHVDGTARVQTVSPENGLLYHLLQTFYQATGVPVLLNTSLNVAGEPIVETPEDAWRCLQTTPLTFCMIEKTLLVKDNPQQTLLDFSPRSVIKRFTKKQHSTNND